MVLLRGDGSSSQQVLTLDKLLSRWGASPHSYRGSRSRGGRDESATIQVEGRGKGMAVVQLKTTYWTTSLRRIQEISSSRLGRVGFDLDPRVELGGKNNTTEVKILSCQR